MMALFYCQDQNAWSNALLFEFLLSLRKRGRIEKKKKLHNRGHKQHSSLVGKITHYNSHSYEYDLCLINSFHLSFSS